MSDKAEEYRRARARAELRADGGFPSLKIFFLVAISGSGILFGILMSAQ